MREKIEAYIEDHKEEMLSDIVSLCEIDSQKRAYRNGMPFGEGAARALKLALEMAADYGFETINYDNYVGAIDLNEKEKQLDILAHLDVVPAGEGWKVTQPFRPLIKDGKIYGRGTSDDKGPAVAALYALRAVRDLGIPLKKNARLVLGTDEECGSECIKYYYNREKEAPMTFSPDGAYPVVTIEKGRLPGHFTGNFPLSEDLPRLVAISGGTKINVVPPQATAVLEGFSYRQVKDISDAVEKETGISFSYDLEPVFSVTAHGENAHASLPEKGNNAITGLLCLLSRLPFAPSPRMDAVRGLYERIPHGDLEGKKLGIAAADEKSGVLTLAFSMLSLSGEEMEGFFDVRSPICAEPENILSVCRKRFAEIGIRLENTEMIKPHWVDEESDFVKTLLKVYEDYTGLKGYCVAMGGGTYVHDIKNGVAFGAVFPDTDTRMHGPDEFAVIDELVVSAKIFAQVIVELCG